MLCSADAKPAQLFVVIEAPQNCPGHVPVMTRTTEMTRKSARSGSDAGDRTNEVRHDFRSAEATGHAAEGAQARFLACLSVLQDG